jgi:hypothetical protein
MAESLYLRGLWAWRALCEDYFMWLISVGLSLLAIAFNQAKFLDW